jgi:hypothetical protein
MMIMMINGIGKVGNDRKKKWNFMIKRSGT